MKLAARVLTDTDPEAAATIQGAAHTLAMRAAAATNAPAGTSTAAPTTGDTQRGGLIVETRRETTRRLANTIGEDLLRALRDQGATMDTDTVVAYTLSRLDVFLTTADD